MNKSDTQSKYCDYCDGTGIVRNPHFMEMGEPPLSPCPRCVIEKCRCNGEEPYFYFEDGIIHDCFCRESRSKIDRVISIYKRSGLDRKFLWKSFNDFRTGNSQSADAKKAAYDIVKNFPDVKKGLFLWGNPGTGKTLLTSIILTELIIKHAIEGRFLKISRNFFSRLKATFAEGSETYGQSSRIEREYMEVDILVIDDFGVQRDSAWEQETLYNLVDARYEAEKFTIFTSNNNPATALRELSQGRILSRIREMTRIMELSGEDYRTKL